MLNPICHLFALLGAHDILHVSRKRVKLINIWFEANLLSLNLNKTHFVQFTSKSTSTTDKFIKYDDKQFQIPLQHYFLEYLVMIHCPGKQE